MKTDDCVAVAGVGIGLTICGLASGRVAPVWHIGLIIIGIALLVGFGRGLAR